MDGFKRIKQLSAEITDKPLLKIVEYLLTRNDMNDKYLNEEKSLKQMVEFIKGNAQKEAKNGMAMIEDTTVYSWAIHYFDETNEQLGLVSESCIEEEQQEDINETSHKMANVKKTKKDWVPEGQLSLFDL